MKLTAALSAVTAAVVGVVLNLAVWFALNALFPSGRINWFAFVVFLVAFLGMLRWRWQIVPVIFGSALAGFASQYVSWH
jgi:chromate transporter